MSGQPPSFRTYSISPSLLSNTHLSTVHLQQSFHCSLPPSPFRQITAYPKHNLPHVVGTAQMKVPISHHILWIFPVCLLLYFCEQCCYWVEQVFYDSCCFRYDFCGWVLLYQNMHFSYGRDEQCFTTWTNRLLLLSANKHVQGFKLSLSGETLSPSDKTSN